MQIHHLLGALLIVCGTVTAADNPGWQNARGCRIEHQCATDYGIPVMEV